MKVHVLALTAVLTLPVAVSAQNVTKDTRPGNLVDVAVASPSRSRPCDLISIPLN